MLPGELRHLERLETLMADAKQEIAVRNGPCAELVRRLRTTPAACVARSAAGRWKPFRSRRARRPSARTSRTRWDWPVNRRRRGSSGADHGGLGGHAGAVHLDPPKPGPVGGTGCGMSPGALGHLFEPFCTAEEVGRRTGLGLSSGYGTQPPAASRGPRSPRATAFTCRSRPRHVSRRF